MGGALAQEASSVCAYGRCGGDDESLEIESAYDDGGFEGFWIAEQDPVVHERTWLGA